jgi:hypothetical protein
VQEQVLRVLRVWESWSIYPPTFLNGLHATFLMPKSQPTSTPTPSSVVPAPSTSSVGDDEDLDGEPCMRLTIQQSQHFSNLCVN